MDSYKTINNISEGYYTDKRSKFYAFAHYVESADDVKKLLVGYRNKYYDARHICWAYRLGPDGVEYRLNDDGEPSSTGGKPIFNQILSSGLTNIVVFVIRYYGGVNLGTSGLIIAYREASRDALEKADIIEKLVEKVIVYSFPYILINAVMKVIKELQPRIVSQKFDNTCVFEFSIRESKAELLQDKLNKLSFE